MNKQTCLCAVAQQAEGENIKIEHLAGAFGADLCCSAGLIHGIRKIGKWGKKETGHSWVGSRGGTSSYKKYLHIFYASVM